LIAQLSDPHVRVGPGDGDAVRGLAAAVEAVAAFEPRPDALLVSGDLAETGSAREYERVRELLAPLGDIPVHVLPGNHDDVDGLREHFGRSARYSARCGPLRLVACDTSRPGRDDGRLGEEQLAWLDAELADDTETPTVVAMHHAPVLSGILELDALGLVDRVAVVELVARHPQVRRIAAGHLHRTIASGPTLVCPSTWVQTRLDLARGRLEIVPEPPGFALHVLLGGDLVSHVQPYTVHA
jgi:Icc protein